MMGTQAMHASCSGSLLSFMQWITYFPVCAVLRPLRILNAWNCLWLVPFRLQVLGQTSKRMPTFHHF
jgi:hypothetical protein